MMKEFFNIQSWQFGLKWLYVHALYFFSGQSIIPLLVITYIQYLNSSDVQNICTENVSAENAVKLNIFILYMYMCL